MHYRHHHYLFKWFNINFMKANNGKSHLLALCREPSTMSIDGWFIELNIREVLLGLTIDRNLRFDDHVNNLCRKAKHLMLCHALHFS